MKGFSTTYPIPPKVLARRIEARDALLALAAGAHAVCRGTNVSRDWAQAIEEDTWRDIERMWETV